MSKRYLTQIFPQLLPIRKKQRQLCFYTAMRFDRNRYTDTQRAEMLPYQLFASSCPMYNTQTGFDMVYQENKAFNLKLASKPINGMLIRPGETFSFCWAIRHADRDTPYKEGLTEVYGKLTTERGGGLCMLSNLLFWLFLHTPLTIVERHGHQKKDFPEPPSDAPLGVDATVTAGWLDLKVRNDTENTFQICIAFDETNIHGEIRSDTVGLSYEVFNGPVSYCRENGQIFEEVDVCRQTPDGKKVTLYQNRCQIGYPLPEHTPIIEEDR